MVPTKLNEFVFSLIAITGCPFDIFHFPDNLNTLFYLMLGLSFKYPWHRDESFSQETPEKQDETREQDLACHIKVNFLH